MLWWRAGTCVVHGVDQVGTVPAALTAYLTLQALQPDLLISAGTAGGFKARGGAIGDVYLSSAHMNHDRRIPLPVRNWAAVVGLDRQDC